MKEPMLKPMEPRLSYIDFLHGIKEAKDRALVVQVLSLILFWALSLLLVDNIRMIHKRFASFATILLP
jgi:hypothetical protein